MEEPTQEGKRTSKGRSQLISLASSFLAAITRNSLFRLLLVQKRKADYAVRRNEATLAH
jgi:hypothetical protein